MNTDNKRPSTIWFTGLSGAGKTTAGKLVVNQLRALGLKVEHLDGDVIRNNISKGLGFSKQDRFTNLRRIGWIANLLNRNGIYVCVSAIAPYQEIRREIRSASQSYMEVYCNASIEVLEQRDPKGLYKKAKLNQIKNFTGISSPYEEPENPEVIIHTDGRESPDESSSKVMRAIQLLNKLPEDTNKICISNIMEKEVIKQLDKAIKAYS